MARTPSFHLTTLAVGLLLTTLTVADGHENLPHAFEAGWQGEDVCEVLFENDDMIVGKCVFPPGVGHEKHFHNPHFGYILSGTTFRQVDADGVDEITVTAGDAWSTDSLRIHEALNVGDTTSEVLIVETKP